MILDGLLMFDTGQDMTAYVAGTYYSANVLDLHMLGIPVLAAHQGARDIGIGDDPAMKLLVQVTVSFTTVTNMYCIFQGAPDSGTGTPDTFVTYATGPTVVLANLKQGARLFDIDVPRPPADNTFPRFLRLGYVTTGTVGVGTVEAGLVLDRMDQPNLASATPYMGGYPAGITIAN